MKEISMKGDTIRLGVIGMGVNNMASTMVLLGDEPDLRYDITAACAGSQETVDAVCARDGIPFASLDYRWQYQQLLHDRGLNFSQRLRAPGRACMSRGVTCGYAERS